MGISGLVGIVVFNCNLLEVGIGSIFNSNYFWEVCNGLIIFNIGLRFIGVNILDLFGSFNFIMVVFFFVFVNFYNLMGYGVFLGFNDNSVVLVFIGYSYFEGLMCCIYIEN